MNIKPSHHTAIRKLLREQPERVRLGKVWLELQRQFECGQVRGDYLYFSASEREALRRQCRRLWGFDPIEDRIDGDRHAAAALGALDEKIARQRPDEGFVLLKGALPSGLPVLSPGLSLRVPLTALDLPAIEQLLLVENLDSFDAIEQYALPAELAGSLILYRGHGGLARGARQLLGALPTSCRIIAFTDYDPAGLQIALTLPQLDALLLPQLTPALLEKGSREHFQRQHAAIQYLQHAELGGWQGVWEQMQAAGVSIKQQHMLVADGELQLAVGARASLRR